MKWRQVQSGALVAFVPELSPECEEDCSHTSHPQMALVPQYDNLLRKPRQEWLSTTWQVWEQRQPYETAVIGRDLSVQDAMRLAEKHAPKMDPDREPYTWDGHERVLNAILANVLEENPRMTEVPEHECRQEFTFRLAPDPDHPGPEHTITACEACIYPKAAWAAYMVMEEGHAGCTLEPATQEEEPE